MAFALNPGWRCILWMIGNRLRSQTGRYSFKRGTRNTQPSGRRLRQRLGRSPGCKKKHGSTLGPVSLLLSPSGTSSNPPPYWQASHSPPLSIASRLQAVASSVVYSGFGSLFSCSQTTPRVSLRTLTVAFSIFEAPSVRR